MGVAWLENFIKAEFGLAQVNLEEEVVKNAR